MLAGGAGWAQNAYIPNESDNTLSVIDTVTDTVTATIPLPSGSTPIGIAVLPNGQKVYVASFDAPQLTAISTVTNTVADAVTVGFADRAVAASPDGSTVYLDNADNTVSVIATANDSVLGSFAVGAGSGGVVATPDGTRLYVSNFNDQTVTAIATPAGTVLATIKLTNSDDSAFGIAASPDSSTIYVSLDAEGQVDVISTATNTVVGTITGLNGPAGLAVSPDGTRLYAATTSGIAVMNTATRTVIDTVSAGNNPFGISITPDGSKVYVANTTDNTVTAMATATDTVVATIPVGSEPRALGQFIVVIPLTAAQKIATTSLTQGHLATAFKPVLGNGGNGALSYSVSPTLPAGLTMAPATGAISGTPTVTSAATAYTVTATDTKGATASATFSLTVNPAVTATQMVATSNQTQNRGINPFVPVAGSGGTGSLSYSISPALPAGVNFGTSTAQVLGEATVTSPTTTYTVTVTDSLDASASATFQLTINGVTTATQAIAATGLTQGQMTSGFTPVIGGGGSTPLSYSLDQPLPPGLNFATGSGAITGTPTSTSPATTYTVTVTDINSVSASASFSLTVNSAVTATQAVPSTSLTQNHAVTSFTPITGAGGSGPLTYSVAPSLPTGLTLVSGTGAIGGTPTVLSATASYTMTVTDTIGASATQSFSLTVNSPVAASQAVAAMALTQNQTTTFTPVTATGGTGTLTYSIAPVLPTGLSLASDSGAITGAATAMIGVTSYTVTATDANGATGTAGFSLSVSGVVTATEAAATTSLTQNFAAAAFQPVTGGGGTGALSYSVKPNLPDGLGLEAGTGMVSGTPTLASSAAHYTVTVTDTNGATASAAFSLTVNTQVTATPVLASNNLPLNQAAPAFTPVTGAGGTGLLSYAMKPSLPAGLHFATDTGAITGTPTSLSAAASYTVTVTDANGANASADFSLAVTVSTSTTAVTSALNPASYGQSVSFGATVTGPGGAPTGTVTFEADGAALGVVPLSGAQARFSTAALTAGAHAITARYSGDNTFAASTATLTETVTGVSAATNQVYSYETTLGMAGVIGTDNAHFDNPAGIAVDSVNGHVLVADTGNSRVQVLDSTSLAVVATLGVSGVPGNDNAHFDQPNGLDLDSTAGHLFVADQANQRVQVFDAKSLSYLATLGVSGVGGTDNGHFNQPSSARINPTAHRLYVADQGNDRVQVFDAATLGYLATLGTTAAPGNDNAHFNQPIDAALDPIAGQILIADRGNARIQLFDATSLAYAGSLGSAGNPAGNTAFTQPMAAGFDPSTNLMLVADAGANDRVQALDALSYGYITSLGMAGSMGRNNDQFAGPAGIAADPAHRRLFVSDAGNDRIQIFTAGPQIVFAATLPGARSVELGRPATIFASVINAGAAPVGPCRVALPANAPAGLSLSYQTTDTATNALTGTADSPAMIAGNNGLQSFLVSFQGGSPFTAAAMPLDFACEGAAPAALTIGVDTVDLAMSTAPVADIIALAATATNDGTVTLPAGGSGAFAVASDNVGIAADLLVSVDTGSAALPLTATLCPSNPGTGQCLVTPAASAPVSIAAGATPTFSVFVQATAPIAFDPANARLFVRFKDASGGLHGSTSVAVRTE